MRPCSRVTTISWEPRKLASWAKSSAVLPKLLSFSGSTPACTKGEDGPVGEGLDQASSLGCASLGVTHRKKEVRISSFGV